MIICFFYCILTQTETSFAISLVKFGCLLRFVVCFYRKYIPLVSTDQRQSYKDDFNAEYDEYRLLHARVESITRRFTQLDARCRKLAPGTKEHQVTANTQTSLMLHFHIHFSPGYHLYWFVLGRIFFHLWSGLHFILY